MPENGGNRRETSRAGKKREEDETDIPAKVTNKSNPAFSSDNIYFLWSANGKYNENTIEVHAYNEI